MIDSDKVEEGWGPPHCWLTRTKRTNVTIRSVHSRPQRTNVTGTLLGVPSVRRVDMNLDGDKTHAVADALASRGVPFVFCTGYSGDEIRIGDRDRPLLKKPFQYGQLAETLERLLPR